MANLLLLSGLALLLYHVLRQDAQTSPAYRGRVWGEPLFTRLDAPPGCLAVRKPVDLDALGRAAGSCTMLEFSTWVKVYPFDGDPLMVASWSPVRGFLYGAPVRDALPAVSDADFDLSGALAWLRLAGYQEVSRGRFFEAVQPWGPPASRALQQTSQKES